MLELVGPKEYERRRQAAIEDSFAADGDGFLYYPDYKSNGIPVSAEERKLYLEGPQRQFFQAIDGRPATGPKRSRWRPLISYLLTYAFQIIMIGAMMGGYALRDGYAAKPGPLKTLHYTSATLLLPLAAIGMAALIRLSRRQTGEPQTTQ